MSPPLMASQELTQEIDQDSISGTLIFIPMTNPRAFFARTPYINSEDGLNLNRTVPGALDEYIAEGLADFITRQIIRASDVKVDVHGGDANGDLLPFICYYDNQSKPKQTLKVKHLSEYSGFEYILSYPYTLTDNQPAKYAFKQAVEDGKVALSIECGRLGKVEPVAVYKIKKSIQYIPSKLDMYPVQSNTSEELITLNNQEYIRLTEQGVFNSTLVAGDEVLKDR